jgi:hypothetical protein
LVTVLLVALLAAAVIGHLEINAEEIQVMQNHIGSVQALATAEAGLNDALAQLRLNRAWQAGFANKAFEGGSCTVTVNGSTIRSAGVTSGGFTATTEAEVIVATEGPPYLVGITRLRINP